MFTAKSSDRHYLSIVAEHFTTNFFTVKDEDLHCPDGFSASSDEDMATLLTTILLVFLLVKIQLPCLYTTYTFSAPPITDSIDITPEINLNKILNLQSSKSPDPDGCMAHPGNQIYGRFYFHSIVYYI